VGAGFAQVGVLSEEVVGHKSGRAIRSQLDRVVVGDCYADYTPEVKELAQLS
jgi:hypothetical protein